MSDGDLAAPVVKHVTVRCDPAEAFRFFTAAFNAWWPSATHSCIAFASGRTERPVSVSFETRLGGLIVEHGRNGERHVWGTIVAWEPPCRVAFSWHPGRPPDSAQRVEVTFDAVPGGTRVVLTHSEWFRLGAEAEAARTSYDQGWERVLLESFHDFVTHERRG